MRKTALIAALSALFPLVSGCHFTPRPRAEMWDQLDPGRQREALVEDAESFVHARAFAVGDRRFPFDCSGLVGAVLLRSGIDVFHGADTLQIEGNGVKILHEYIVRYGSVGMERPLAGDILFFSNTYDKNRDGKLNDGLTHTGIVEKTDDDGTVTFIHHVRGGVRRYVMNLRFPGRHEDGTGKVINSYLRRKRPRDAAGTSYLAGDLYAGTGSLVRDSREQTAAKTQ